MSRAREAPDLDAEAEVDLDRYGRALLLRWWLLLAGLVVGAVIGYLTTLGGTQFFRAQAVVYMGQPLGAGQVQVQALNTNPSSARTIVTSESVVRRVSRRTGMSPGRIRSGTSVTAVQGSLPKLGQTPLVQVTVKGPEPGKVARAANALADALVKGLSSGSAAKIQIFTQQSDSDKKQLEIVNQALAQPGLSTTDKILLQGRIQGLQSELTLTTQLLLLAKNVEAPRVVTHALAEKASARNHRNSTAVGALIGLILGGIAALLWEPVTRVRRRES
jgi:capsular polysaccharide biosynthesis protein